MVPETVPGARFSNEDAKSPFLLFDASLDHLSSGEQFDSKQTRRTHVERDKHLLFSIATKQRPSLRRRIEFELRDVTKANWRPRSFDRNQFRVAMICSSAAGTHPPIARLMHPVREIGNEISPGVRCVSRRFLLTSRSRFCVRLRREPKALNLSTSTWRYDRPITNRRFTSVNASERCVAINHADS